MCVCGGVGGDTHRFAYMSMYLGPVQGTQILTLHLSPRDKTCVNLYLQNRLLDCICMYRERERELLGLMWVVLGCYQMRSDSNGHAGG